VRKNKDFSKGPVWEEELNRYLVDISYPDQTRKRKRFRSQKKAQAFWAREMTAIEEGTWKNNFVPKNVTLGQAFDQYREYCKAHNRSYRTHTHTETSLKAIEKEFIRDTPLARITTATVEQFKLSRVKEVSEATVDKYLSVFKAFFNWCDVQGIFHANPVRKVRMFRPNNQIVRYLNADEYQRLLTAAEKIRWYLRPVIEIAANTGLRRGNILERRWDECDRKSGVIRKAKTKNNEAVAIPMNAAVDALDQLEKRKNGSPYVFPHMQGEQEGEAIKDVKNSFRTALKKAKIEKFRFHALRHCCASWLMMNGADLNDARQILGHKSIAMTLRYAHLSPRYLADKVKLLEKATLPNSCQMQDATRSNSKQVTANRSKS
jgi:integrase